MSQSDSGLGMAKLAMIRKSWVGVGRVCGAPLAPSAATVAVAPLATGLESSLTAVGRRG